MLEIKSGFKWNPSGALEIAPAVGAISTTTLKYLKKSNAESTRWRTLVQKGMYGATDYYLRSGRGAVTADSETTNKNEPHRFGLSDGFGDRRPSSFGVGTIRLFTLCPPVRLCSSGEWARAKKGLCVEGAVYGW
jgi:hypothetical protein